MLDIEFPETAEAAMPLLNHSYLGTVFLTAQGTAHPILHDRIVEVQGISIDFEKLFEQ